MKASSFFILTGLSVFLMGCGEQQPKNEQVKVAQEQEKIVFENTPEDTLALVNQQILVSDTIQAGIASSAAKGNLWTAFTKSFNGCFSDATFKKNIVYLGASNSKYLGALLSKDKSITWKTLEKVFQGREGELSKFVQKGKEDVSSCDNDELNEKYFDILLEGQLAEILSAKVKVALEDKKSIKFVTGKWRIDEIVLGDFNSYIDSSTNPSVMSYKKYLLDGKNFIVTKVLVIQDFTAEIESNRVFETGVNAELTRGITSEVKANDSDTASIQLDVRYKSQSAKTVKVSGTGTFYAIGMVQQVKKIKSK